MELQCFNFVVSSLTLIDSNCVDSLTEKKGHHKLFGQKNRISTLQNTKKGFLNFNQAYFESY